MTQDPNEMFSAATGYIQRLQAMSDVKRECVRHAVEFLFEQIERGNPVIAVGVEINADELHIRTRAWGGLPTQLMAEMLALAAARAHERAQEEQQAPMQ